MNSALRSALCVFLSVGLGVASIPSAAAELISTSEALALEQGNEARVTVDAFLARQEVADELASLGVDPELARLRAAALSPSELEAMARRIHEAPAGGGLVAIFGVTFVVLLILELVGVIDIFKKF